MVGPGGARRGAGLHACMQRAAPGTCSGWRGCSCAAPCLQTVPAASRADFCIKHALRRRAWFRICRSKRAPRSARQMSTLPSNALSRLCEGKQGAR